MVSLAKTIILIGLLLVVIGGVIYLLARTGLPIGRLPGDFRIQTEYFTCVFPLATMLILSVILTILLNVAARLLHK
jgi:hypothetical protein